jgi:hypothetical protein
MSDTFGFLSIAENYCGSPQAERSSRVVKEHDSHEQLPGLDGGSREQPDLPRSA